MNSWSNRFVSAALAATLCGCGAATPRQGQLPAGASIPAPAAAPVAVPTKTAAPTPAPTAAATAAPAPIAQTVRVLENLSAILEAAGTSMDKVVRCTVFLKDMGDFRAMNDVYGKYFNEAPPARSTVEVARLPKDVLVEIDVVALTRE